MEIIKKNVNGEEYTFFCWFRGTRSGFAHDVELFHDGELLKGATIHYFNRTWEQYEFQSVMKRAAWEELDAIRARVSLEIKKARGWQRLTAGRRGEIAAELEVRPEYRNARALYQAL